MTAGTRHTKGMHWLPATSAVAAILVAGRVAAIPALADAPRQERVHVATAALGDLSSFRAIASDTLAIVGKGDIPAARARVKDLETTWDKAESSLKPQDKAAWTALDRKIDEALTDLRSPNPRLATCEASLRALIAEMDKIDRA